MDGRSVLPADLRRIGGIFPDWVYLILPAITLAAVSTAYAARIMRSQMLEVLKPGLHPDRAREGPFRSRVLWRHASRTP